MEQGQGSEAERSEPPAREMPALPLSPRGVHRQALPRTASRGAVTVSAAPTPMQAHPVLLSCFSPEIKSFRELNSKIGFRINNVLDSSSFQIHGHLYLGMT